MNSKLLAVVFALFALPAFGQQKAAYTDAEAAKHVGEEATVTGKVVTVSTTGKGTTFLNFGARYPNETFGAVIFASKAEAVGDVKQYEGKDVSVTGKIEMSPTQKPQIVINSASQIKLAGAAETPAPAVAGATPMPAQVTPSAPTVAVSAPSTGTVPATTPPPPPAEKRMGKIGLGSGWSSPRRDGEMARKDLAKLFGALAFPGETVDVDTSMEVYPGVPLLTSLAAAKKTLNVETIASKKSRVDTAGFPQNSFTAHEFGGVFPGGFDRLYLVTDVDDQVVSMLLVDNSTRTRVNNETDSTGYHVFNFVAGSGKGATYLVVKHELTKPTVAGGTIVVDTMLIDPTDTLSQSGKKSSSKSSGTTSAKGKTGKVLERSRWFVPTPVVSLILRSVGG